VTTTPDVAVRDEIDYRPVRPSELETCAELWRLSTNDYIGRLNQPLLTETAPVVRLYGHLQATDPERFVVATRAERIVAFASAVVREHVWFLSMCFVLPEVQGRGIGRRLLERIGPADPSIARATATDSAQPISNALYASLGIVPREPLLNFVGTPMRPEGFGALPSGILPVAFDRLADGDDQQLMDAVGTLDRRTLSVSHPVDHRWLRREGRRGFLYHGPDGEPIAYGYAAGRVGSDRWPASIPTSSRRSSVTSRRRSCRAAPSRCGCRGPPAGPSSGRSRPGSGSSRSRSCCAGTGRSPTCRGTCRSPPDCSRPVRTVPSSGAP
jgi:GNAT superfamily N-acetyltransferase